MKIQNIQLYNLKELEIGKILVESSFDKGNFYYKNMPLYIFFATKYALYEHPHCININKNLYTKLIIF